MPRRVKGPDGVLHVFPDDATDAEISTALSAPPPTARGAAHERSWTDAAVDALPTAGGLAGGIIGGIGGTVAGMGVGGVPGAVGGATLGGGAGEALKQLVNRARGVAAPGTPLEAATGVGREGAIQGVSEAAGAGVMKAAGMAAHGLMDFAIRPAPSIAKEFTTAAGDIADTALRERIPVGRVLPGMRKGSNVAQAALREASGETRAILNEAGQAGTMFNAQDVARGPVSELVGEIAKQPLSEAELVHVSRMFSEYAENHGTLTPERLKDLKQAAQRIAKPIFRALNQGNVVPAGDSIKAQFNKAVAEGAKDALETIPRVGAAEARTQSLIGVNKAIRQAEVRRLPLMAEVAAPVVGAAVGGYGGGGKGAAEGVGATLLTRAVLSPRTTSRIALRLSGPALQQALRQMPRAAVYALLEQLQEDRGAQGDDGQ